MSTRLPPSYTSYSGRMQPVGASWPMHHMDGEDLRLMQGWPMSPRLKAGIYVRALIRRAEVAGAIFIKIARLDGTCTVLNQARNGEGELVWAKPLGDSCPEDKAGDYF